MLTTSRDPQRGQTKVPIERPRSDDGPVRVRLRQRNYPTGPVRLNISPGRFKGNGLFGWFPFLAGP